MENDIDVRRLVQNLEDTGISSMTGSLLYSSLSTLYPGQLYVLGYNPGGDPAIENATVIEHLKCLLNKPNGWNEYVDGIWRT